VAIERLEDRRLLSASLGAGAVGPLTASPALTTVAPSVKTYGVTLHLQAGQSFNGYLGMVTGAHVNSSINKITASINWGDGSQSSQGVVAITASGHIDVGGMHTYSTAGNYAITIVVYAAPIPIPGQPTPNYILLLGTIKSKAIVAGDSSGGVTLHEKAGTSFTASVGTFQFPAPGNGLAANISWGDGTTSKGTLVPSGIIGVDVIKYEVDGTHTYAKPGTYAITVTVTRSLGPPGSLAPVQLITTINSTADVSATSSLSLNGTISGTYKLAPVLADIGATYVFTGTGAAGAVGPVALSGSVHLPGFIATGKASGTLTLDDISASAVKSGSVTLSVTGPTEAGFGPFPGTLSYVITGGTGAFAGATGSGTIAVTLDSAGQTFTFKILSN
jgi:hypothetical protein